LTASVKLTAGATLTIRRRRLLEPTDTVLATLAIDPWPMATDPVTVACALVPSAMALRPRARADAPMDPADASVVGVKHSRGRCFTENTL